MPARSIAVLVSISFALCVAWIVVLPPWQGPDEPAHYAYVERLANGQLPPIDGGELHFSQALSASVARSLLSYRTRGSRPSTRLGQRILIGPEPDGLSTAGHAAAGATSYPPLYYTLMLPFYALGDRAVERLYWIRLGSALIATVFTALTSLLIFDVTASHRLALGAGLLAALPPMLSQAGAIVSPDILLAAGCAGSMLALRRAVKTASRRRIAAVLVALAVVSLSKPVGVPLAAVLVVSFAGRACVRAGTRSRPMVAATTVLVVLAAAYAERFVIPSTITAHPVASVRELLSYLWQFYLPRLGFMQPLFQDSVLSQPVPVWGTFVRTGIGYFGWISAPMPDWSYVAVVAGTAAALLVALGDPRRRRSAAAGQAALFILLTLAVLHLAEFSVLITGSGSILQGRYLLPAIPAGLVIFCALLARASRQVQSIGMGIAIATWLLAAAVGLSSALEFYAT